MARPGHPWFLVAGRLIAQAAGCGSRDGAGHGFRTSLGAGLRITMAAGLSTAVPGSGGRVQCIRPIVLCGRPPMCLSSDSVPWDGSVSDSVPWDGCRSDRVIGSTPGTGVTARTSTMSTSRTLRTSPKSRIFTTDRAGDFQATLHSAPEALIPTCVAPPWTRESVRGSRPFPQIVLAPDARLQEWRAAKNLTGDA